MEQGTFSPTHSIHYGISCHWKVEKIICNIAWRKTVRRMYLTNINSTIAENINFFMYKYNFTHHDWFGQLHVILKKRKSFVINSASTDMDSYILKFEHMYVNTFNT